MTAVIRRITRRHVTVEGIVCARPWERHSHSVWVCVRTNTGRHRRVIVATSAEAAPWIEPGARIRATGTTVVKPWKEGPRASLTCHESVEMRRLAVGN
jgi:hypothetical protein